MGKGVNLSIPHNYEKHVLPDGALTQVNIGMDHVIQSTHKFNDEGIDSKDIPSINDNDYSITLNGFFLVRWTDRRLLIDDLKFGPEGDQLVPVDVSMVNYFFEK